MSISNKFVGNASGGLVNTLRTIAFLYLVNLYFNLYNPILSCKIIHTLSLFKNSMFQSVDNNY